MTKTKRLGFVEALLFAIASSVGLRWLPVSGATGPSSLVFWLLALLAFYIPETIAVLELTEHYEGTGSVYTWVRETLGEHAKFVCGWFYWISVLPYLAGLIYFLSGLFLSAAGADPKNVALSLPLSLGITAFVTVTQVIGLRAGKWLTNIGSIAGWSVVVVILVAAGIALARNEGATNFVHASYVPPKTSGSVLFFSNVVFGFAGIESLSFLRDEIRGGQRTIRRVLVTLGAFAFGVYTVGTMAMLVLLPQDRLTHLEGFADAIRAAFGRIGHPFLAVLVIAFFALTQVGALTVWFGIAARAPAEAGIDHVLPRVLTKKRADGEPPRAAVLMQGALTALTVVLAQAGEGAAAAYDFLLSMSVLTAGIPYVFIFAAHFSLKRSIAGAVGFLTTVVALICTLAPSASDEHPVRTFSKILASTAGSLCVGLALYGLGRARRRA